MQTPNLLNLFSQTNIIIFMLVFTRITGLISSAPFFSTLSMPLITKTWFSALIAFILYPMVLANYKFILPHNMAEFIILTAIEFFVGYLIGYVANLLIEGARMAGSILSIQMGLSISEALDPATGVSSNILSRIYIYFATLVFLATGAANMLFATLYSSFESIPCGMFVVFDSNIVQSMIHLFAYLFKISFAIALPIFAVLLICDVLLGLMSKMMPQMNVYMVAIPVKIYIGLFLMMAFLSATNVYLTGVTGDYMNAIGALFAK